MWIPGCSDRSGEEQLWVCNADGSDPVQITFGALRPGIARWSPDGGSVVFNHVTRGDMYVVSSRGGQPRRIGGAGTTGFQPAFSADGKWIYFFREPHIYRMPSAGGPVSQLSGSGGRPLQFSSDGRFVYFVKGRTDSSIWKAGVETGAETMVLDGLLPGYWGSWALAPGGIYYLGESAGSPHLLFYDFSTKRPEPVAPVPEPLPPIGTDSVSFSPDLRRLICVRIDPTNSDVFRLEGFR
jgi:Tol biopolymer transport system component